MLDVYLILIEIANKDFQDIVINNRLLGGKTTQPNKLRLDLKDNSFLDVWLSADGDYSYHWEHRAQRGLIHRWDNAPDHEHLDTFPQHFHDGNDETVRESILDSSPEKAIRTVLEFIRENIDRY